MRIADVEKSGVDKKSCQCTKKRLTQVVTPDSMIP
jgi:hypothetical protein